jgi:hypothetical protein
MTESIRDGSLRQPDAQDVKDETEVKPDAEDVSPHYGRRAQPGDVLGLETGGETTAIGDTAEDENKRRRDAAETNSE